MRLPVGSTAACWTKPRNTNAKGKGSMMRGSGEAVPRAHGTGRKRHHKLWIKQRTHAFIELSGSHRMRAFLPSPSVIRNRFL